MGQLLCTHFQKYPSSFFCELCKEVAGSAGSEPHMVSSNQSFRAPTRVNRLSSCFVQPEWSRAQDRFTPTSTHCRSVLLLGPVRQSEGSGRRRRLDGSSSTDIQSLYAYSFWTNCSMTTTLPPRARSPVHGSNLKLSGSYGSQTNMGLNLIKNRLGGMARAPNALPRFRQAAALRHHLRPRLQSGRGVGWGRAGCPRSGVEEPSRLMGGLAAAWPLCSLAACRRFEK